MLAKAYSEQKSFSKYCYCFIIHIWRFLIRSFLPSGQPLTLPCIVRNLQGTCVWNFNGRAIWTNSPRNGLYTFQPLHAQFPRTSYCTQMALNTADFSWPCLLKRFAQFRSQLPQSGPQFESFLIPITASLAFIVSLTFCTSSSATEEDISATSCGWGSLAAKNWTTFLLELPSFIPFILLYTLVSINYNW